MNMPLLNNKINYDICSYKASLLTVAYTVTIPVLEMLHQWCRLLLHSPFEAGVRSTEYALLQISEEIESPLDWCHRSYIECLVLDS